MDYSTSQTANADIDQLTLSQLEHETLRLQARLKAVRERIVYLMASKNRKKVRKKCSAEGCTNVAQKVSLILFGCEGIMAMFALCIRACIVLSSFCIPCCPRVEYARSTGEFSIMQLV